MSQSYNEPDWENGFPVYFKPDKNFRSCCPCPICQQSNKKADKERSRKRIFDLLAISVAGGTILLILYLLAH